MKKIACLISLVLILNTNSFSLGSEDWQVLEDVEVYGHRTNSGMSYWEIQTFINDVNNYYDDNLGVLGCDNEYNSTADWDECGNCVGGTTGQTACTPTPPSDPAECNNPTFNPDGVTLTSTNPSPAEIISGPSDWGKTWPEKVEIEISTCIKDGNWITVLSSLTGLYSQQVRLVDGVNEVSGTSEANFCKQVSDMKALGFVSNRTWYMLSAVQAHEDVHLTHFLPALKLVAPDVEQQTELISVPNTGQTYSQAIIQIKNSSGYTTNLTYLRAQWEFYLVPLVTPGS